MHSQSKVAPSTCTQHNKVLSVFCLTCQEAVCMTCAFKSPEHKGHDWEELSEAMERCIQQSEEVLSNIIQTASTLQVKVKQKAQANNPQCLQLLDQMGKCNEHLGNAATGGTDDKADILTKPHSKIKIYTENPIEHTSALAPNDGLPTASLPQSVNKDKFEFLASAKLPEFKYIDMNRRSKLLLTFPQNHYAIYKIHEHRFCSMEQPALSDKTVRMLRDTKHAVLSQNDELVVQAEYSMMCHNTTYSFGRRYMCKVHVCQWEWINLSHRRDSVLICDFMKRRDETSIHQERISLDSLVSFS